MRRKPPLQDVIVKNRNTNAIRRRRKAKKSTQNDEFFDDGADFSEKEKENELYEKNDSSLKKTTYGDFDDSFSDKTSKKWLFIALGIGFTVVATSVVLSFLFAGATVTAYPKQDTVVVNEEFTAGDNQENGDIPIKTLVLENTEKQEVVALGEEEVEERASGKITIYNDFSGNPQRLIKNTRFKSSKNLIYRIRESVEVPGRKDDGTPGEVEVTVFAEEPGEKYNMGPDTFSIPGFVGLPQEGKVYAKSVSDITGGYVGVRRTVNEKERMSALEKLESKLRDELLAEAFEKTTSLDGYVLFKEAVFFEFNTMPDEIVGKDKVTLSLTGKLHGILLPEDLFAKRVAENVIPSYDGSPLRIENIKDLSVSISPVKSTDEFTKYPWKATSFNVTVKGKAHFIWSFDEKKMAEYFKGKDKDILETMPADKMSDIFPGIDRITVNVRPFWKNKFPDSLDKINVEIKLDG